MYSSQLRVYPKHNGNLNVVLQRGSQLLLPAIQYIFTNQHNEHIYFVTLSKLYDIRPLLLRSPNTYAHLIKITSYKNQNQSINQIKSNQILIIQKSKLKYKSN